MGALVAHPLANVISRSAPHRVPRASRCSALLIFTGTPIATVWGELRDFFTAADVEEEAEPEAPVLREEPRPKRHRAAGSGRRSALVAFGPR